MWNLAIEFELVKYIVHGLITFGVIELAAAWHSREMSVIVTDGVESVTLRERVPLTEIVKRSDLLGVLRTAAGGKHTLQSSAVKRLRLGIRSATIKVASADLAVIRGVEAEA